MANFRNFTYNHTDLRTYSVEYYTVMKFKAIKDSAGYDWKL